MPRAGCWAARCSSTATTIRATRRWCRASTPSSSRSTRSTSLVGPYATNMAVPAIPVLMQHKMTTIAVTALAANSQFHYPGYFVMLPSGPQPKRAFAEGFFNVAMQMNPKPKTIALAAADAEFAKNSVDGAREIAIEKPASRSSTTKPIRPATTDYGPVVRAIQATNPDIVLQCRLQPRHDRHDPRRARGRAQDARCSAATWWGSHRPPAGCSLARLPTASSICDAFSPSFKFPGLQDMIKKYQARAAKAGTDPLGYSYVPFAYGALAGAGRGRDQGRQPRSARRSRNTSTRIASAPSQATSASGPTANGPSRASSPSSSAASRRRQRPTSSWMRKRWSCCGRRSSRPATSFLPTTPQNSRAAALLGALQQFHPLQEAQAARAEAALEAAGAPVQPRRSLEGHRDDD